VRNHARSVLACDFFVAVTAGFRRLYIFVVLEVGTRRILHSNVTDIQRASGRRSSSAWWSRAIKRIDSWCTITTAFTRRASIAPLPP
jgi:hypothetical protein